MVNKTIEDGLKPYALVEKLRTLRRLHRHSYLRQRQQRPPSERGCRCFAEEGGIIEYTRVAVRIVNRKKLEAFACECYGIIRQYDGELGSTLGPAR